MQTIVLFIIRVKRELKRVYRNGCRYNERLLNPEIRSKAAFFFLFPKNGGSGCNDTRT